MKLSISLFALLTAIAPAWALPKYADWARLFVSGAAVPNAQITVVQGATNATIYSDVGGTTALANPFAAASSGYYEFYTVSGEYEVRVSTADGSSELYRLSEILLIDPTGPQMVCSDQSRPALTTEQVAADQGRGVDGSDLSWEQLSTASFRLDRRSSSGTLDDAPWFISGYRAEQGIAFFYNTFGRPLYSPIVAGKAYGNPFYSNTADEGNFVPAGTNIDWHVGGLVRSGNGGVWIGASAGSAVNVDMGIDGTTPAANSVVVLSTTSAGTVKLTTTASARAPFVVTAVQGTRALVAVAGVAIVNAVAPITVGQALVTSTTSGYAKAAAAGTPAPSTLGSALTALSSGTGTVYARVGMVQTP